MMKRMITQLGLIGMLSMTAAIMVQADTVSFGSGGTAFTMDFVAIGKPGNPPQSAATRDHTQGGGDGYGQVQYEYDIGTYEVTIEQFTKADIASGNVIGNGNEDHWYIYVSSNAPASEVSFHEAARFCNWLTSGSIANGAYEFDGSGSVTNINRGAALSAYGTAYVVPTRNEWNKAAYYDMANNKYTLYAFGVNTAPVAGTEAVYSNLPSAKTWDVGSGSMEQNGTFDLMGNVWEWTEELRTVVVPPQRRLVGGAYHLSEVYLASDRSTAAYDDEESHQKGFRVARINYSNFDEIFAAGTTNEFSMNFVAIGSTNNAAQSSANRNHSEAGGDGFGAVDYEYAIGTYEISIGQFVKADAASGNMIGNGNEDHWIPYVGSNAPASEVSFHEAARFCNWLTSGSIMNGAYQMSPSNTVVGIDRTTAQSFYGKVYVLPSRDEWHKAAYYNMGSSNYTLYAFGLDTVPVAGVDSTYTNLPFAKTWAIGSGFMEQNGTYDMMGNVWEWSEEVRDVAVPPERRLLGGAYHLDESYMASDGSTAAGDDHESYQKGFRVALVGTDLPSHVPATILSLSPFSSSVLEMVIACPTPESSYPKIKTDLVSDVWSSVGHSASSGGPFTTNNLGSVPGELTIYLEATGSEAFYGIGEE